MGLFGRRRKGRSSPERVAARKDDLAHMQQFIQSRTGVEGFIEPRTTVTETTVILIAHDGEWTRRRVAGPDAARQFAHRSGIPIYDVRLVGYPRRMRDYNERSKRARHDA